MPTAATTRQKASATWSRFLLWWRANDTDAPYLERWLLLTFYAAIAWWQVERVNSLALGSHLETAIILVGFFALAALPRKWWPWVLVAAYLASNMLIYPISVRLPYTDHQFFLHSPIDSIRHGLPIYRPGLPYPIPYLPFSSLMFWPLLHFGVTDLRYLFAVLTALSGLLLWLPLRRRPEGLILLIFFLFNGYTHESNLYQFLANTPFIFFFFLGLYLLSRKERSLWGAAAIGISAAIKQQPLVFLPFLFIWWAWRRQWKPILLISLILAVLVLPFAIQSPHWFYVNAVQSFTDYYPNYHFSFWHSFWKWDEISIHNIIAVFPGGTDWAWTHRKIPVNAIVYAVPLLFFALRKRSWNKLLIWHAAAGLAFFVTTLTVNWPLYYLVFLLSLAFLQRDDQKRR